MANQDDLDKHTFYNNRTPQKRTYFEIYNQHISNMKPENQKTGPWRCHRVLFLPCSFCSDHSKLSCSCFTRLQKARQMRTSSFKGRRHAHEQIGFPKVFLILFVEPPVLAQVLDFLSSFLCKDMIRSWVKSTEPQPSPSSDSLSEELVARSESSEVPI